MTGEENEMRKKTNSKGVRELIIGAESIKLRKETGENSHHLGSGKACTDTTPKAKSIKENNDKLDFIKIKDLSSS